MKTSVSATSRFVLIHLEFTEYHIVLPYWFISSGVQHSHNPT